VATRLTDDLDEMDERQAKVLVRVIVGTGDFACLADRLSRHVEHVPDECQRSPETA
jgi:hypothetical protein